MPSWRFEEKSQHVKFEQMQNDLLKEDFEKSRFFVNYYQIHGWSRNFIWIMLKYFISTIGFSIELHALQKSCIARKKKTIRLATYYKLYFNALYLNEVAIHQRINFVFSISFAMKIYTSVSLFNAYML